MVAWLLTRWSDMLPMGVKWATKAANAAEGITAPLYPISEARILGRGTVCRPRNPCHSATRKWWSKLPSAYVRASRAQRTTHLRAVDWCLGTDDHLTLSTAGCNMRPAVPPGRPSHQQIPHARRGQDCRVRRRSQGPRSVATNTPFTNRRPASAPAELRRPWWRSRRSAPAIFPDGLGLPALESAR